jgi:hypothetical protein
MPRKCIEENCKKQSSYNNIGEKTALYCKEHKKDGMIDVKHKTCIEENCKTRPSYNNIGEKTGLYCKQHKKDGMIDVISKTCIEENCKKQSIYNNIGEKTGLYCKEHKKDGMIDVKHKTCIEENCKTRPSYNNIGEKTGLYCKEHKKDGMIDVESKTCIEENCKTRPSYNNIGEKTALYCKQHKKDGMIDVISKTCMSDWCNTQVTEKYEGYCLFCYVNLFPDKEISRNYKTKEKDVTDKIKTSLPDFTWVCDKKVQDGCSKRRPDMLLDLGFQVIIVEVDENQHNNYENICENKRTMEISQDLNHRPIIFIRFNPDNYIDTLGKTLTSCWKMNQKTGLLQVSKSKAKEWFERMDRLIREIEYWIGNKSEKVIRVINLFYDN